jgi:hypothetical protein
MPMSAPPWIISANLTAAMPPPDWEDDPWECAAESPRLENKIAVLWSRAILALAAGFAEWIVWRPGAAAVDPLVAPFLEAVWASVIDRRYLNHVSQKFETRIRKSYQLPTKPQRLAAHWTSGDYFADLASGPQRVAIYTLADAADLTAPRDFGSMEATYISNLVEQIVGKGDPFKSWRRNVIGRLTKFYGSDADEPSWLGPPVPREALDLNVKFEPSMAPPMLSRFLAGLDPASNPFLTPAKEMVKLGFEGTPYTYP